MIDVTLVPIIPRMQNYAYILRGQDGAVAVVDPGDAQPIIDALEEMSVKPDMILITHHHWDHVDGIEDMLRWHDCPVIGPQYEAAKIPQLTQLVDEESDLSFGGEAVRVIHAPGHCQGHIMFYFEDSQILMAGDVIFSMGCGRLLDGTAEQLYASFRKIEALPDETQIYCGHEYTATNAAFCLEHDPKNVALQKRSEDVQRLLQNSQPTLPVTLAVEKETNLFLRANSVEEFAQLRALRDQV